MTETMSVRRDEWIDWCLTLLVALTNYSATERGHITGSLYAYLVWDVRGHIDLVYNSQVVAETSPVN